MTLYIFVNFSSARAVAAALLNRVSHILPTFEFFCSDPCKRFQSWQKHYM